MRRSFTIMAAAVAVVACGVPAANASGTGAVQASLASGGTWGTAKVVPGTAALNSQGDAGVIAVSCPSAGNCGEAGSYKTLINGHADQRPFVGNEKNGVWQKAREVPGLAALHVTSDAFIEALSCASAGNCSAIGDYIQNFGGDRMLFVVTETNGTWGHAEAVTGFPDQASPGALSLSCGAPGDCVAVGDYSNAREQVQVYLLDQTGGAWGSIEEAPGSAALNTGNKASLESVSCVSAGNCSAGGYYTGSSGQQAFVINETGGSWGNAEEVPGSAALNTGGNVEVASVSCASAGNCTAGGDYTASRAGQVFVAKETGGTWAKAKELPGVAALNTGGEAQIDSLSCGTAGNCSTGGYYYDATAKGYAAFVATEKAGTWANAEAVPGLSALNPTGFSFTTAVSCAASSCSAGGYYDVNGTGYHQAFVLNETGGTWSQAENVPGTTSGSGDDSGSAVATMSCASASRCVAGGSLPDSSGQQAYVVSKS